MSDEGWLLISVIAIVVAVAFLIWLVAANNHPPGWRQ